ncbi:MAG TPA: ABC transporter ATP-binding protein [Gemmatimonadaceae bacterium]|nr:ABC transporter ATP-binding protein [Gemmatimonadaceae bacterium]
MAEKPKNKINYQRAWAEARELIWRHRKSLTVGLILMVVNRLSGLVLPASSKYVIDEVLAKGRADLLMWVALGTVVAVLISAATSYALSQVVSIAAQEAIAEMRMRVQKHVLHLPVSYFDSTKTGVLISRIMSDAEGVRNLVGTGIVQLVGGLFTAVVGIGILFSLNWRLTTIVLVVLITFGTLMSVAFSRLRPLFRERSVINAEVTGRLGESLGGVRILKVYVAEQREEKLFGEGVMRLFENVRRTITGTSLVSAGATLIIGAIGVIMITIGGRAILNGTMTLGGLVMYIFFIGLVAAPLIQIANIGTQISEAFAGLDRIREIRDMATEDDQDAELEPLGEVQGSVEFKDVTFSYTPGIQVLKGVSFVSEAGSTTALVGSSGSGKSTLIGLVMSFNRPESGTVLVDGHDISKVRLRDYRSQLGVVMQDNFLFDGTIRENIAFARPDATDEEIKTVSRIAHCDEFVEQFAQKYDTVVGERGVKLSGGQRQRVAIARAILADPRILILDEATSSLDSESEAMIRDGLRSLRRGRTTFVIAHRLSTIESADQILVLEEGQIVERGTHQALITLNGRYRQLYDKQYGLERDRFINPGEDFTPESPNPLAEMNAAPRVARSL